MATANPVGSRTAFRAHLVMPDGALRSPVYFTAIALEWLEVKQRLVRLSARA